MFNKKIAAIDFVSNIVCSDKVVQIGRAHV